MDHKLEDMSGDSGMAQNEGASVTEPSSSLIDAYPEFKRKEGADNFASFIFPLDMKPLKLLCIQEIKKAQTNAVMPGFRKGRVPIHLVESQQLPAMLDRYLSSFLQEGFRQVMKPYIEEGLGFLLDGFQLFEKEDSEQSYQITQTAHWPDTLFVEAHFEMYKEVRYQESAYADIVFEQAKAEIDPHSYHMMVDGVCRTVLMPQLVQQEREITAGDVIFCHLEGLPDDAGVAPLNGKIISVVMSVSPQALGDSLSELLIGRRAGDAIAYTGAFPNTFSFEYLVSSHAWSINIVGVYTAEKPFTDLFTETLRDNVERSPLFAKMDTASFDEELNELTSSLEDTAYDPHPYMMINSESLKEAFQSHVDMILSQLNRQKLLSASMTHLQSVETSYVPMGLVQRYVATFFDFLYAWNKMSGLWGQSLAVFPYARIPVSALLNKKQDEVLNILKEDLQWFVGKTYFLINQMLPTIAPSEPTAEDLYAEYRQHCHAFITPLTIEAFRSECLADGQCFSYLRYLYWERCLREWLLSRVQIQEAEPLNSWSLFVMPGFCIL